MTTTSSAAVAGRVSNHAATIRTRFIGWCGVVC
jgi:hypothetical protein